MSQASLYDAFMSREPRNLFAILWRGLGKRCPRCGQAPQFESWFTLHERCSQCSLQFEKTPGDTWGFWVLGDRIFIAITIALIFFGLSPDTWQERVLFLTVIIGATILTMPRRQGVCTALDYYVRRRLGEDE